MEIFSVGGAVRDELLGLPVKDRDYVVVGSTPSKMLAMGYRPVGKDFPVFLHPDTHEEYALARTERKTAKGYKGFEVHASPEVTLEQDLSRRDFTMNAIAKDSHGQFIDPFQGIRDIRHKIIRHVSTAFTEDPLRILRAARFSARFSSFSIAPETQALMQQMVVSGELDALVPERVWQEIAKGLMEEKPSRMFETLKACGALRVILPELDALWGVPQTEKYHPEIDTGIHVMMVVDYAAKQNFSLAERFAALTHDLGKGRTPPSCWPRHIGHEERSVMMVQEVVKRLRVPNACKQLALLVAKYHGKLHTVRHMRISTLLEFLEALDAFRQSERFEAFLHACEADYRGRLGMESYPLEDIAYLHRALSAAKTVDTGKIAQHYQHPEHIRKAIADARIEAIQKAIGD